jgi:hypothetical protein
MLAPLASLTSTTRSPWLGGLRPWLARTAWSTGTSASSRTTGAVLFAGTLVRLEIPWRPQALGADRLVHRDLRVLPDHRGQIGHHASS